MERLAGSARVTVAPQVEPLFAQSSRLAPGKLKPFAQGWAHEPRRQIGAIPNDRMTTPHRWRRYRRSVAYRQLKRLVLVGIAGAAIAPVTTTVEVASGSAQNHYAGQSVSDAYRRARTSGATVSLVTGPFEISNCTPIVVSQRSKTKHGRTNIWLKLGYRPCGVSSPAVPTAPPAPVIVPDLVGDTVLAAQHWADVHEQGFRATKLTALRSARAKELLGNYRVKSQNPPPGASLTPGHATHAGSWRVTPLVVTARRR